MSKIKGTIGILTGGGDVPGLNPAIRAVTIRALREGYRVIGIRRGWEGLISMVRDKKADNSLSYMDLSEELVNKLVRTGGTFLHTSRTRPSHIPANTVPEHLKEIFNAELNDLTPEVLANLAWLGIEYLIPIGGDDTLSYAAHLQKQGFHCVAIPKTMDNDVPGTDYCIGFSTAVTRIIKMTHDLRTTADSHQRLMVVEVFGRYAGFTALLPTMAGAANRCLIPEHPFCMDRLTELLMEDRRHNQSSSAVVLVSEGAKTESGQMLFEGMETDMYGHRKLGGIGDYVSAELKKLSAKYNNNRPIHNINQRLGYLIRSGEPDALDSIVPMVFGNMALDLILKNRFGRLVSIRRGQYDDVPLDIVTSFKKVVDVNKYYNTERYRPVFKSFEGKSLLIMTSDI
ncbi:ATP-dependent 6-phosphofructokinase [bacterium]|nr:ATP-dependent 6-phosphofructokinase [candidate division CSSED10-310 bacterium]